jgi:hypothetical protein
MNSNVIRPRSRALHEENNRSFSGTLYVRPHTGYIAQLQLLLRKIHPMPAKNRPISSRKRDITFLTPCQMPS